MEGVPSPSSTASRSRVGRRSPSDASSFESRFLEPTLALALSLSSPLVVIVGLIVIPRCPRCDTNLARSYLAIMLHYQGMQCPKCGLDVSEMAR